MEAGREDLTGRDAPEGLEPSAYLTQGLLSKVTDVLEGYPTSNPEDRAEIAEAIAKGLTEYAEAVRS